MSPFSKVVARCLLALVAMLWVSACVRLNEPDVFICNTDADCNSGERCSSSKECVSLSVCDADSDCRDGKICDNSRCVAAQCTEKFGQCGFYSCFEARCAQSCRERGDCAAGSVCASEACVQIGQVGNGDSCDADADCKSKQCCTTETNRFCADSCPKAVGVSCASGAECLSNYCCTDTGKSATTCTAVPCSELPVCRVDADCSPGKLCNSGKCVAAPAKNGAACFVSQDCQSGWCEVGTCRGLSGGACSADIECQGGYVCCAGAPGATGTCSGKDNGCPKTIGGACGSDADCLKGSCGDFKWCTVPCLTNSDCGISPWGDLNVCQSDGYGNRLCFPGCTSATDCHQHLYSDLTCFTDFSSTLGFCGYE